MDRYQPNDVGQEGQVIHYDSRHVNLTGMRRIESRSLHEDLILEAIEVQITLVEKYYV